jgi:hypothetical protein
MTREEDLNQKMQEAIRRSQLAEQDIQRTLNRYRRPELTEDRDFQRQLAGIAEANQQRHEATLTVAELAKANMASEFHARLMYRINDFDESLDNEHEVGVKLVSFGQTVVFRVEDVGYHNPSLIVFHGRMDDGNPVTLVQHVSQISFLLTSLKRPNPQEPKVPFGFTPQKVRDFHDEAQRQGMAFSNETGHWTDKDGRQFDREGNPVASA